MSIARKIAKNSLFSIISSVSEMVISFGIGILLTRGLGTEQYGLYSYTIWLLTLTGIVTNLGLGEMSRRFIPEAFGRKNTTEAIGYVQLSLIFRFAAAILICLVIMATASYWARQSGDADYRFIFILVAVMVLPNTVHASLNAVFKGFQKFNYSLYIMLTMYLLRLILVIIFISLGYGVQTIILVNMGTFLLGIIVGIFLLHKLVSFRTLISRRLLSADERKQALKYSLIVAGTSILVYLLSQQAQVYFVGLYCTVEDVGFYWLAFRIGAIFGILPTAFGFVLLPVIAERYGSGEMEVLKRVYITSSRCLMVMTLPVAVGAIVLASPLITIIYGTDYHPVVVIFQIIALPFVIGGLAGAGDAVIRGINRPVFLLISQVIFAVLNISLSLVLIPRYGTVGAAIVYGIVATFGFPVFAVFIKKKIGAGWPIKDTVKVVIASAAMGLIVYAVSIRLGNVLSLVIGIPLGAIVYIAGIFILGFIRKDDMAIVNGVNNSLPVAIQRYTVPILGWVERVVVRTGHDDGQKDSERRRG